MKFINNANCELLQQWQRQLPAGAVYRAEGAAVSEHAEHVAQEPAVEHGEPLHPAAGGRG